MKTELDKISWPLARVGEAIEALARESGYPLKRLDAPAPRIDAQWNEAETLNRWLEGVSAWMGLEAERAVAPYIEVEHLLRTAGPVLIRLDVEGEPRFLALIRSRGRKLLILAPSLKVHSLPLVQIREAICRHVELPLIEEINRILVAARVPARRQQRARSALLGEFLANTRLDGFWLLRLPAQTGFGQLLRQAGLLRRFTAMACAYIFFYAFWILSWIVVGRGVLRGQFDEGWFLAWAMLLMSMIPARLFATWSQGFIAIRAGSILKQRLLTGALGYDIDEVRQQGIGQLLGRVVESEAVESLAMSGGFLALFASVDLSIALFVLKSGAGGWLHTLLLLTWVAIVCTTGWHYYSRRAQWTRSRFKLTQALVERMVGYRTRAVQEARERWHDGEDQSLEQYLILSGDMDRRLTLLMALAPRGWLILGFAGLVPEFVYGKPSSTALAISIGGILFAYRALSKAALGISHLSGAMIAWREVAPLFHQASRADSVGSPAFALKESAAQTNREERRPLIEANNLIFNYPSRGEQVLRGGSLRIYAGDRLLLEGASGGGKSTLASLLNGLRHPQSGLIFLSGLDRQTLGSEGWRRRVVTAPQFHENHVLTETFAFNLLMGRRWPPRAEDLQEAKALCQELGLGNLLESMPAGMFQMVGETGWQLSHGEKSRLYIARALLQKPELVILDESFAALDPETLRQTMRCVVNRAATLLVIAHP
ncbi:MAG TPA: ABC transporter ATP-binding protein [Pyrinomonadaceae bacterium]|jgi:ATP-binding cassette subfamily B protein